MSIIETAIHKAQQLHEPARSSTTRPHRRRVPPTATPITSELDDVQVLNRDHVESRKTKVATLDPVAMAANHVLLRVGDQAAQRAYKILRTRVLHRLEANSWHSLVVTGSEVGEGKTLTAINLAIALSQDPHTSAILVDLDLQRPQIAATLGLSCDRGLGEYLMGEAEIEDIVYTLGNSAGLERLSIIPNTRALQDSSESLVSVRMLELLTYLQNQQPKRVLIFDMPPMMLSDDVLTFAPQVDGVLMVVSEGYTNRSSVEKSLELLAEMNLIGVVLNRSSERNDAAYY
jgi:Mrp family chromosome partitioning ATPase